MRPRASVPEKAIAIHRIPAAASSGAWPFFTNANAKISTHEIAKKSVVVRISRLFTSIAKSLRSTSQRGAQEHVRRAPDQRAIARPEAGRRRLVGEHAAAADQHDAVDQAVGKIQIVCRQHDDGAARGQRTQAVGDDADGAIVEPGERFVEQHEPRPVQQRAFERQPLPHPARKPADRILGTVGEARRLERRVDGRSRIEAVQLGEERKVLPSRQFRIQMQFMREQPDADAKRRAEPRRRLIAVAHFPARRHGQRRENRDQRRFAGAVRPEQADDVAGRRGKRDARERAAAAEMAGDVDKLNGCRSRRSRQAARPARSAGSGPASSPSSAL